MLEEVVAMLVVQTIFVSLNSTTHFTFFKMLEEEVAMLVVQIIFVSLNSATHFTFFTVP